MRSPLTLLLSRLFVKGFFRAHTGFLVSLFVLVFSYFFFIQVLNPHLTREDLIRHNLILSLNFLHTPIMMIAVLMVWLIYAVKSIHYVKAQLALPMHHFLYYSITAFNRKTQFRSWAVVQFLIALPMIAYALFLLVVGIIYGYYVTPLIGFTVIILLIASGAYQLTAFMNTRHVVYSPGMLLTMMKQWPKPRFSWFLFSMADRLKLMTLITKCISAACMLAYFQFFSEYKGDGRILWIIGLGMVIAHAILVYQSHQFSERLTFLKNFPKKRMEVYGQITLQYLLLLLPETIWVFAAWGMFDGLWLLLFMVSLTMLLRSYLYFNGTTMVPYLRFVLLVLTASFIVILSGAVAWLVIINTVISYAWFYRGYYRSQPIAIQ